MDGTAVAIRLRRSTPSHDAYTVRVYDRSFTALVTARPADARRWVSTTRWLHSSFHHRGRLVVGLGVQWTPTYLQLHGVPPVPATLQLCVGRRCLLFHLAHAGAVPETLRRFLADPRVTFVGSGAANDSRILWVHYGLHVARGCELRAVAGMGNASLEDMAGRFLGYPGIGKPRDVAMSAWHAPRLSPDQVQYACVDAYLAFHLGLVLCCPAADGGVEEDKEGYGGYEYDDEEGYDGDDLEDEEGYDGDDLEDDEGYNGDDLEDEDGYDGDDLEDEDGYHQYTGTRNLTDASNMNGYAEFVSNGVAATNMWWLSSIRVPGPQRGGAQQWGGCTYTR